MDGEKFVDAAKAKLLYEYQQDDDNQMLEEGDTNTRVNQALAQWLEAVEGVASNWSQRYRDMFSHCRRNFQRHYLAMDGYGREQAIAMRGATTLAENAQARMAEKKKGLVGLLGS